MTTIAALVYDAVIDLGSATPQEICSELSDQDRSVVISAIHRLKDFGTLRSHRALGVGVVYSIAPGAQRPEDKRGRPRNTPDDPEAA